MDGQRRLIAVVMGADSPKGREDQARKLLHWGQQNFDTVQILHNGKKVGTERIWYGDKEQVNRAPTRFLAGITESRSTEHQGKIRAGYKELEAPIAAHQRVGEIRAIRPRCAVAHCRW